MASESRSTLANSTDSELIERYRYSHDTKYVGELYLRYSHLVLGVCIKYLKDVEKAKDANMFIFEKLVKELKKHSISNFKSWLYSVSKNYCMQELRKSKITKGKEEAYRKFIKDSMENVDETHLNSKMDKLITQLDELVPNLKEKQRLSIEKFYLEGKSYVQIASEMNVSEKSVKSYIQNGKRNLKLMLEAKDGKK